MSWGDAGGDALGGAGAGAAFGPWGAGIGAGLGLAKYFAFDRPKEKRQLALAAATQRYSPWTGLKANAVEESNPIGGAMQGGVAGAQLGQNISNQQSQESLNKSMADYYKSLSGAGAANSASAMSFGQEAPFVPSGSPYGYARQPNLYGMGGI